LKGHHFERGKWQIKAKTYMAPFSKGNSIKFGPRKNGAKRERELMI
jgi:hypothetical protein